MSEQTPSRKKVKITVLRRFKPPEVFTNSPAETTEALPVCEKFVEGQEFVVNEDGRMPSDKFCYAAWEALWEPVRTLAFGGNYPWFKDNGVSVNCCPDGLRPVIFKLERI